MLEFTFEEGESFAQELDARDELAAFRDEFVIDDPELIYLDGNSLGRLAYRSLDRLQQAARQEWGHELIRSWGQGWYEAPQTVGEKIARLVGAAPGQVIVADSTSVDLFKLSMAALAMRPGRSRIVSDVFNFPSDLYVLQGCIRLLGDRHTLHLVSSEDGISLETEAVLEAIDADTALVSLSHVSFKSGYLHAATEITARAEKVGALVLWDLSHSTGVVPVDLDGWGAHFAIGCTYKYLNGGPGAPAFLYIRQDLQNEAINPIWGWFGQLSPFSFELDYSPAQGITRFLCGTPPMLSLLTMERGVELILEAGIERIREKSIHLSEYLIFLFDRHLAPMGFSLGSPRQAERRGSHVSLRHSQGYQINRALIEEMGVLPDFREPDNLRLGLAPLYTSYHEVWQAIERIRRTVVEKRHLRYPPERQVIT